MNKTSRGPWRAVGPYVKCADGYNVASVNSHRTIEGADNMQLIIAAPDLRDALYKIANLAGEAAQIARVALSDAGL